MRVGHLQPAAAQHVQVAMSGAGVEALGTAQRAGVMQLGADPEPLEDAGKAIDGNIGAHRTDWYVLWTI
jgi:hypothetical protein